VHNLSSALISDVLDTLGVRNSFCGPQINELWSGAKVSGQVATLRCVPTEKIVDNPYQGLFDLFKVIQPGEVIVIEAGEQDSGVWGELLSVAAIARGSIGVVTDGLVRDKNEIADLKFPVFCAGTSPLDSSGRQIAIEMQTQVRCGRMQVNPKDWVVADELGVVFIPQHLVDEVFKLASEKQLGESIVRNELAAGQDIGEVFARHGIL
jgi:4-hydroxy-4-methyl-2-oxoglutarate aldolase